MTVRQKDARRGKRSFPIASSPGIVREDGRGRQVPRTSPRRRETRRDERCTYVHDILRFAFVPRRGRRRGVVRQIHHRHVRLRFRFRPLRGGGLGRDGLLGTAPEEAAYVARHRARRGTVSRASSEAFDKSRVPGSGGIARGAYAGLKIFFQGAKLPRADGHSCGFMPKLPSSISYRNILERKST